MAAYVGKIKNTLVTMVDLEDDDGSFMLVARRHPPGQKT